MLLDLLDGWGLDDDEVRYNAKNREVYILVPGIAKDEIGVSIDNGTLKVSAKPKENRPYASDTELSFSVEPSLTDKDIKAHLENGVLTIKLGEPHPKEVTAKTIAID